MFRMLLLGLAACATATYKPPPDDGSGTLTDAGLDSAQSDTSSTGCAAFTGVLATWDFAGEPGNEASTPVKTTADGIVAGSIQRGSGLSAVTGANSINSSGWSVSLDSTKYYTFTLAPPAGCRLSLSSLSIDARASTTGPQMAKIATSADTFTETATLSTSSMSTPTVGVLDATTAVELRIYGFGASSTAGTLRLQTTLSVTGTMNE